MPRHGSPKPVRSPERHLDFDFAESASQHQTPEAMSVASGVLMIAHLEASKVRLDPSVIPHTRSLLRNIRVRGVGSGGAALPSSLHLFWLSVIASATASAS